VINPKSVHLDQLYGDMDPVSHDWIDGLISFRMRECVEERNTLQWIVFDGPVDAVWIESMNTVLDDNKKLTLSSGEIIQMTTVMTMLFEVEDLDKASPATVSRCGMIYLDADDCLDWRSLIMRWMRDLPVVYDTENWKEML
jgi:dynein heavy chain